MIIPRKLLGDSRASLLTLPEKSIHCCITSIPYWGLRSYLPKGHPLKHLEIGCEPTFELYLDHISEVFKAVHRAMRDDGTLWLNCGDAYSNDTKWGGKSGGKNYTSAEGGYEGQRVRRGKLHGWSLPQVNRRLIRIEDQLPKLAESVPGLDFDAKENGTKHGPFADYYGPESLSLIRRIYSEDFAALQYPL